MQADAARRDFTMNALYADAEGKIFDYFNGRADLAAGHVKFIGDASARIDEDVLRILRFFRFHAWFGKGDADKDALAACAAKKNLLPNLSAERVWREVAKLLAAENPVPSLQLMQNTGVLAVVLPEAVNILGLAALLVVEAKNDMPPSSIVRLAALLDGRDYSAPAGAASGNAEKLAKRLKLSNREAEKLVMLAALPAKLKGKLDPVPFRRALYEYGADACRDAVLILAAEGFAPDVAGLLDMAVNWQCPTFPVQGSDVLALGLVAGPKVGKVLREVEAWWVADDFRPTRDECLAKAKELGSAA